MGKATQARVDVAAEAIHVDAPVRFRGGPYVERVADLLQLPAPAVCFGAALVNPKHRCSNCCHQDHFGQAHGDGEQAAGHMAAEGISLYS